MQAQLSKTSSDTQAHGRNRPRRGVARARSRAEPVKDAALRAAREIRRPAPRSLSPTRWMSKRARFRRDAAALDD